VQLQLATLAVPPAAGLSYLLLWYFLGTFYKYCIVKVGFTVHFP